MSKKTKRLGLLSFNAVERTMSLRLGGAGIQMPETKKLQKYDDAVEMFDNKGVFDFGFFGSGNNANTYYPGLNVPKDVIPKPEDFIEVPFRLLTATTVGAYSWKATDFSKPGVLKASLGKLTKKPVYFDHDQELMNWLGIVKGTSWSEQYTTDDGILVPAGIDGLLSIDAKSNPKFARGLLIGSIFSNSVTVLFEWEPSHVFTGDDAAWQFDNKLGTMHEDGTMIRRVVTKILDYYETSLVWLGADPFSKLIDKDGNLVNIDADRVSYEKEKPEILEKYKNEKKFSLSFALNKEILNFAKPTNANPTPDKAMNELQALLATKFGMKAEDITADKLKDLNLTSLAAGQVVAKKEDVDAGTAAVASLAAIAPVLVATKDLVGVEATAELKADVITAFKAGNKIVKLDEYTALEANATAGKEYLKLKREEAIRLYKVNAGPDKVDAAVVALFEKAESAAIDGLLKLHVKDAAAKFSGCCADCGSANFQFRSSLDGGANKETKSMVGATGTGDIYSRMKKENQANKLGETKEK